MDKEAAKKEIVELTMFLLSWIGIALAFSVLTLWIAIVVNNWLAIAWAFLTFTMPVYMIVVWRSRVVHILREIVER